MVCNYSADDPHVMAGLGTVGVEIITQLPEADAVIVPVAGGALLASVLIACKKLKCSCLVYVSFYNVLLFPEGIEAQFETVRQLCLQALS